jgi:hypothetical protein
MGCIPKERTMTMRLSPLGSVSPAPAETESPTQQPDPQAVSAFEAAIADGVVTDEEFQPAISESVMSAIIRDTHKRLKAVQDALR